jgi:hypothetical protein
MYAARTWNGFTPASRAELFKKLQPLETKECLFANLPEKTAGRWGAGLTAAKMKECRWLKPVLVGQFEFVEWTADNHLRHSRFVGLRDDKKAGTSVGKTRRVLEASLSETPARPTPVAFARGARRVLFARPARLPQPARPPAPHPDLRGHRQACARRPVVAKS